MFVTLHCNLNAEWHPPPSSISKAVGSWYWWKTQYQLGRGHHLLFPSVYLGRSLSLCLKKIFHITTNNKDNWLLLFRKLKRYEFRILVPVFPAFLWLISSTDLQKWRAISFSFLPFWTPQAALTLKEKSLFCPQAELALPTRTQNPENQIQFHCSNIP